MYEIAVGKNATVVCKKTGRNSQTVPEWVHRYNDQGPLALVFEQTGGHPPLSTTVKLNWDILLL